MSGLTIVDLTPRIGLVNFDGIHLSFIIEGIATETAYSSTSPYTLTIIGVGANGQSNGTYTISFTNSLWPPILAGTWVGTLNSGSGVITQINSVKKTSNPLIKIYPNPAKDIISIVGISEKVLLKISDLNGRVILSKKNKCK